MTDALRVDDMTEIFIIFCGSAFSAVKSVIFIMWQNLLVRPSMLTSDGTNAYVVRYTAVLPER